MRIVDVETILLALDDVRPIPDGLQDVLLVLVHTDEGITGIGEGHTMPTAIRSVIEAPVSQLALRGLRDLLVGEDPSAIPALWDRMMRYCGSILGRRGLVLHAMSAVDLALWDIAGRAQGVPVSALLGGSRRDTVPVYASDLMPRDEDELLERARTRRAQGFTALKYGWNEIGADVERDIAMVAALRSEVGGEIDIMIDVGMPLPLSDAVRLAEGLGEAGVAFLEEPLAPDDFEGYRALGQRSPVAIATGEKETGLGGFVDLVDRAQVQIIQPDLARAGGFTEASRIAAHAALRGVRVVPHCWSTDILVAATAAFVSTLDHPSWVEFNVTDNPLRSELAAVPLRPVGGRLTLPTAPGLGIELNPDTVARYRRDP